MKATRYKVLGVAAFGLIVWGIIQLTCFQWIEAGQVGVMYSADRGLDNTLIKPCRVFVPWRHQLYRYPTMIKSAYYCEDTNAGESKTADSILITTSDNASTKFDVCVFYQVTDVLKSFNTFGAIPIEDVQTTNIRRAVREIVNNVGTQYDVFALMGPKRQVASEEITKLLRQALLPKGISVLFVTLNTCYPDAIKEKVTQRVNSLTELKISDIKRQIAEIHRQTEIVKAQAQVQAQQLRASQAQAKSIEALQMDNVDAMIDAWDGRPTPIQIKPGETVIINKDALDALPHNNFNEGGQGQ